MIKARPFAAVYNFFQKRAGLFGGTWGQDVGFAEYSARLLRPPAANNHTRYASSSRSFSSTEKSSNVVTSPATEPLVAISRNSRRMIFPDRVFGNMSVKRISS